MKSKLNIKFSRHAKRRMKLYKLKHEDIKQVIHNGEQILKSKKIVYLLNLPKFKYPIKVVAENEEDYLYIITAYPLKRGYK